jgi:hypothetical protein
MYFSNSIFCLNQVDSNLRMVSCYRGTEGTLSGSYLSPTLQGGLQESNSQPPDSLWAAYKYFETGQLITQVIATILLITFS